MNAYPCDHIGDDDDNNGILPVGKEASLRRSSPASHSSTETATARHGRRTKHNKHISFGVTHREHTEKTETCSSFRSSSSSARACELTCIRRVCVVRTIYIQDNDRAMRPAMMFEHVLESACVVGRV